MVANVPAANMNTENKQNYLSEFGLPDHSSRKQQDVENEQRPAAIREALAAYDDAQSRLKTDAAQQPSTLFDNTTGHQNNDPGRIRQRRECRVRLLPLVPLTQGMLEKHLLTYCPARPLV
jgi:hypothetical protein